MHPFGCTFATLFPTESVEQNRETAVFAGKAHFIGGKNAILNQSGDHLEVIAINGTDIQRRFAAVFKACIIDS